MRSFAAVRMTERSSLSPLGRAIVRRVAAETTTRALLIALVGDPAPCVATINRLNPEHLCFFIPETLRPKIETDIQPNLAKLPKKWDWILTSDPHGFGACYKALNQPLGDLLRVWGLAPGELTVDLSRATTAMAAATGLATLMHSSQVITLKTAVKALDMASVFGGPAGIKSLIPRLKENSGFLEKLVLDPAEVKAAVAPDLLANARRRAEQDRAFDAALLTAVRALEAFAQVQLFKQHKIKAHDVQPDQLPAALKEVCRTCSLDDVDGQYKLPTLAQLRALAGLGEQMGQAYLAQWPQMKPLLDAANRSPLGHGCEPAVAERYHQLYVLIVKVTGVTDAALPKFPTLEL